MISIFLKYDNFLLFLHNFCCIIVRKQTEKKIEAIIKSSFEPEIAKKREEIDSIDEVCLHFDFKFISFSVFGSQFNRRISSYYFFT